MKKVFLLITLVVLALVLVACGGNDTPVVTDPSATTTSGTPTVTNPPATTTFNVKFVDAEIFESEVLSDQTVRRGKNARAPQDPSHEGYVFLGWDVEDYSTITKDMVITATYRKKDNYKVSFYDQDGTTLIKTVEVKEGEAIADIPEMVNTVGYIFSGWDKQTGLVDRAWADFEAYKSYTNEELESMVLEYKTVAVYKEADAVVPYKKGEISMDFVKQADGTYLPKDPIFAAANNKTTYRAGNGVLASGSEIPDSEKFAKAFASITVAWNGEYIYFYADVTDPTLYTMGKDYCEGLDNPWANDSIEVWYSLGVAPAENSRNAIKVDAWGYRKFTNLGVETGTTSGKFEKNGVYYSYYPEKSNFFEDVEYNFVQAADLETPHYYAIFKIPAKTESGEALDPADVCYFSTQINDLRKNLSGAEGTVEELYAEAQKYMFSSGDRSKYDTYQQMSLGAAE